MKLKGGPLPEHRRRVPFTEEELMFQLRFPQGLSLEAQWMEHRPQTWCPLEWFNLFDRDLEMWPFIIEIAESEGCTCQGKA